jgi:HEAT repeat protein
LYTERIENPVKQEAYEKLGQMEESFKNKDVECFLRVLREDDTLVLRVHAVCALAEIGDETAVPALTDILLHDPNSLVRHEASFSLGQMGFPSGVEALMTALIADPSDIVRHESAAALGSIGDERARGVLEKATHDKSEEVRGSALASLFNLDYLKNRKLDPRGNRMPRP